MKIRDRAITIVAILGPRGFAPPKAIQNIWTEMNQLTEPPGGRPGIDFTAVSVVAP
jgi:hypothetical protein